MPRKRCSLTITVPIPTELAPSIVLQALQQYSPVMRHRAPVTRFQQTAVGLDDVLADPFFREDGTQIVGYTTRERVRVVPGVAAVAREVKRCSVFQRHRNGIRVRARAPGGVVLWTDYRVRPIEPPEVSQTRVWDKLAAAAAAATGEDGGRLGDGPSLTQQFEIAGDVVVECGAVVMPFVRGEVEAAHRDVCEKVIDELVRAHLRWDEKTTRHGPGHGSSLVLVRSLTAT